MDSLAIRQQGTQVIVGVDRLFKSDHNGSRMGGSRCDALIMRTKGCR
jgi:hypothetical protein